MWLFCLGDLQEVPDLLPPNQRHSQCDHKQHIGPDQHYHCHWLQCWHMHTKILCLQLTGMHILYTFYIYYIYTVYICYFVLIIFITCYIRLVTVKPGKLSRSVNIWPNLCVSFPFRLCMLCPFWRLPSSATQLFCLCMRNWKSKCKINPQYHSVLSPLNIRLSELILAHVVPFFYHGLMFICSFTICSRSRRKMQGVANVSFLGMFIMYLLAALFGYLTFNGESFLWALLPKINKTGMLKKKSYPVLKVLARYYLFPGINIFCTAQACVCCHWLEQGGRERRGRWR